MDKNLRVDIVSVTGIAASAFTSFTLLPQLIKIIREKNSDGTSFLMLIILLIGLSLWIIYGIMKKDTIIIVANAFSMLITLLTGIFALKHRSTAAS